MAIRIPQPEVVDLPVEECEYGPDYDVPKKWVPWLEDKRRHKELQQVCPRIYSVYTSFQKEGQRWPIIVIPNKDRPGYWIHAGNMRWTVAKVLGWKTMRARIATDEVHAEQLRKLNYTPPAQCGRCNQEFYISHECPKLRPSP